MTIVATLTARNDSTFEGSLMTLMVSAPITIVPNPRKTRPTDPDYRILSRRNGFELGAGWTRTARGSGSDYISVAMSAPEFGTIYGNIANAPGGEPGQKVIIWNPPA